VYLVEEKYARHVVELLKRFEGPDLGWYKFRVKTSHVCSNVPGG
jgi:predicted RNA binding protein YcfA (HicA-like mRNA interferase family)